MAVDAYLQIVFGGDDTETARYPLGGDSQDAEFPYWLHLRKFSVTIGERKSAAKKKGVGDLAKTAVGQPARQVTSAAVDDDDDSGSFPGVKVTIDTQFASPKLMEMCAKLALASAGKEPQPIEEVNIIVRKAGTNQVFLHYKLEVVTVSEYTMSVEADCDDDFTLNYEKLYVNYQRQDDSGKLGNEVSRGVWELPPAQRSKAGR